MDPELDTELEGLKELLNLLIDEIIKKVERIGKHMILISSVEEVLEREIETKTIIQIKKELEKFPLASSVLYVVPEGIEHEILTSSDARILAFRKAIDYSIWEIKNKLNVIRDFVSATDSLKKTLTIANVVRKVKKCMEDSTPRQLVESMKRASWKLTSLEQSSNASTSSQEKPTNNTIKIENKQEKPTNNSIKIENKQETPSKQETQQGKQPIPYPTTLSKQDSQQELKSILQPKQETQQTSKSAIQQPPKQETHQAPKSATPQLSKQGHSPKISPLSPSSVNKGNVNEGNRNSSKPNTNSVNLSKDEPFANWSNELKKERQRSIKQTESIAWWAQLKQELEKEETLVVEHPLDKDEIQQLQTSLEGLLTNPSQSFLIVEERGKRLTLENNQPPEGDELQPLKDPSSLPEVQPTGLNDQLLGEIDDLIQEQDVYENSQEEDENESKQENPEELLSAVDTVIGDIDSTLQNIKGKLTTGYAQTQQKLEENLMLVRILKEIRQLMILYDSGYEYPSAQDLKKTTQKINQLHSLGQGKLVIIQELANNTLNEIKTNISNFRKKLDITSFSNILTFARLLRDMKTCLDSLKPQSSLFPTIGERVNKLKHNLIEESLHSSRISDEENSIKKMQEKISYLHTKCHLMRLSLDYRTRAILDKVSSPSPETEFDSLTKFLKENASQRPLGEKQSAFEALVSLLRLNPIYLTKLIPFVPFKYADEFVQMLTFSLFSDLFLVREDLLLLKLLGSIIQNTTFDYKNAGEIIRVNSFFTKLISSYTKRQSGRLYLMYCLREPILAMLQSETTELDAEKLFRDLYPTKPVDPNSAESDPEVQKILTNNRYRLLKFCKQLFDSIFVSLSSVPFGIRWTAKQLALRAKRMFPSLSERDKNLLLGGYIFLRYITPAIISPEVYGIVDFKIESAQRRTLVLAAKVLQNMANDQLFQKERYMQPMNNFLTTTKPLLSTFLNNLIDINEPEEYLGYLQNINSKMERAILISPKDLYQLLSLMKENQTKLIMGPKDPLVKILQQFSSFEVQVSNKPTLLKVESRDERPPPSELESIKQEIIQLFCSLEVEEIIPDSPSFYTVIKNLKVPRNQQPRLDRILSQLDPSQDEKLLSELENDYRKRLQYYEYLLMDKIELLQAIEQHKREALRLADEKAIYSGFVSNAKRLSQRASFRDWLETSPQKQNQQLLFQSGTSVVDVENASIQNFSEK